jgi:hypothetical protein
MFGERGEPRLETNLWQSNSASVRPQARYVAWCGTYATKLPKKEADTAEWQAAIESLMLVAELGGPTMFARIGVMRALNRSVERTFDWTRKEELQLQNERARATPSARKSEKCNPCVRYEMSPMSRALTCKTLESMRYFILSLAAHNLAYKSQRLLVVWPGSANWGGALLPDDAAALFTHQRVVSVDLAGKSRPARGEISQNLGFSFTLR